jgi:recombinational DNA repair protein RecR
MQHEKEQQQVMVVGMGGEMVMMDEMEQVKGEYLSVMLVLPLVGGEI